MSIRAYKIIKTAKSPSFNVWHDGKLLEALGAREMGDDSVEYISIEKDVYDELMKSDSPIKEEFEEQLKQIGKDFGDDTCLDYICY